jgi:hypothetical protein
MHRCALKAAPHSPFAGPAAPSPRRALLLKLALMAAVCAPGLASAQVARNFPQTALRGVISFGAPPELLVGNQAARLAPGARIRGTDNMVILSGALVGQRAVVNYTIDSNGNVFNVWILRPEEVARQPWPRTPAEAATWQFDAAAQTWTRP